ncbi:MAG: DMT family transporter [Defluviimonas sp.]|uniref:DMT family transporter n=1 Tax=Albidovulum sp. TaxID=1872424 RepID=UPI001D67D500|nr:DMT family transporter [Paracoccaceae bacterium]MCC0063554.1 DMT family transporter [Defluviimonas sp.]
MATRADSGTGAARTGNRTMAAAWAILGYAVIIGYTDNHVRLIAATHGVWQFHATRTLMAVLLVTLAAPALGLDLRPKRWRGVVARSLLHGFAILMYFGCLAFLPVAVVAAGLFTSPIFVLLIARLVYGQRIGPFRIAAAALGFAGAVLVLGPQGGASIGLAAILPVAAAVLYALGNIATREWCEGESTATLTLGFFLALGALGLAGLALLALWQPVVPEGAGGFILRGWVWPSREFLEITALQAVGSLVAIALMLRAYQIAEASRVAVFEYVILPASALWSWRLWGEVLEPRALVGMALIFAAGVLVAARGR